MDIFYIILSSLLSLIVATITGLYFPTWKQRLHKRKVKKAGPQYGWFGKE
jgi:hypothetical protein